MRQRLRQRTTSGFQLGFNRRQDAFTLHPQGELCLVVLFGQALGFEYDAQQGEAHLAQAVLDVLFIQAGLSAQGAEGFSVADVVRAAAMEDITELLN